MAESSPMPVLPVVPDMKMRALSVALLVLGSCAPETGGEARGNQVGNGAAKAEFAEPALRPAQPVPTPRSPARSGRNLAVDAEGLHVVAGATPRPLPFGLPQERVLAVLQAFRGPADRGTNSECGAGPLDYAVWADGLTLHFQDGRFAGWALDGRAEGAHSTRSGIGPGSTRRELEAAYNSRIEQSSLGTEFTAGGISGILHGAGGEARITDMWAGLSCVFR